MTFEEILHDQLTKKYYTMEEICYDDRLNIHLDRYQYNEYLKYKSDLAQKGKNPELVSLPLSPFNSPCLYYASCRQLQDVINDYRSVNHLLPKLSVSSLAETFSEERASIRSCLFSELEGSLNIEGVPATRKRVESLLIKKAEPQNKNDIAIKNMANAMDFILKKPDFNEENLFSLYKLLSHDILDEHQKLKPGDYYRYEEVEIDHYSGCPSSLLKEKMATLFSYANDCLKQKKNLLLLPHIAHYYIVYLHPYFDVNGRTARMVSLWLSLLAGAEVVPLISEAINQCRSAYYLALERTRDSGNDLTYFLSFLLNLSAQYGLTYADVEHFQQNLLNQGILLSGTDKSYLKKILIGAKGKFTYLDFERFASVKMSKQGALKFLNRMEDIGLLTSTTIKKVKLFEVNWKKLPYKISLQNQF